MCVRANRKRPVVGPTITKNMCMVFMPKVAHQGIILKDEFTFPNVELHFSSC